MRKIKNEYQVSNNNITESHNDSSFLLSLKDKVRLSHVPLTLSFILPNYIIPKGADYGNNHR